MHQRLGRVISLCAAALGNYFNGHQTKSLLICTEVSKLATGEVVQCCVYGGKR